MDSSSLSLSSLSLTLSISLSLLAPAVAERLGCVPVFNFAFLTRFNFLLISLSTACYMLFRVIYTKHKTVGTFYRRVQIFDEIREQWFNGPCVSEESVPKDPSWPGHGSIDSGRHFPEEWRWRWLQIRPAMGPHVRLLRRAENKDCSGKSLITQGCCWRIMMGIDWLVCGSWE